LPGVLFPCSLKGYAGYSDKEKEASFKLWSRYFEPCQFSYPLLSGRDFGGVNIE